MIEQIITQDAFAEQVQTELAALLESTGDEYAPELQTLSLQFAEQYYRYLNGATDADRKSAEANIRHIKAALVHISARMGLDLADRIIKICTTVLTIAATAAVKAII